MQMALIAARILYGQGAMDVARQQLMADGKVDEDEGGDMAVNLLVAANRDLQQQTGQNTDPRSITVALPAICLVVAEFAEHIGGIPPGTAGRFARQILPAAIARFKTRHLAPGAGPAAPAPGPQAAAAQEQNAWQG